MSVARAVGLLAMTLAAAVPARAQRVAEVQVAPPYVRMRVDAQVTLLATAYDADGNPVVAPVRWESSNIHVAHVDSLGVVQALAPGTAIVRAIVAGVPRSRSGRSAIYVMREPGMAAAAPPVGPTPGPPPGPGPGAPPAPPRGRQVDSIIRANINCEEPFLNSANPMRACWDVRPRARTATPVVATPPDCRQHGLRQARVLLRVSESGDVVEARVFVPTPCPALNDTALALGRRMTFEPASREGRPVRAWVMVSIGPDPKSLPRRP